MNRTRIAWTDYTWNPVTGCTRGCDYCYAKMVATRFQGGPGGCVDRGAYAEAVPNATFPAGFKPTIYPHRLDEPLRIRKPSRIFVCSMGDLFDPAVPEDFIASVFTTMRGAWDLDGQVLAPERRVQHTYIVLTKRPERMRDFMLARYPAGYGLHNAWLGVTAENQAAADERIPLLLQVPAAVRFVSIEPMLGPVDLRPWLWWQEPTAGYVSGEGTTTPHARRMLHWLICGGETGPHARPMHPDWPRMLRSQCEAAGVPLFFKSWGEWCPRERAIEVFGEGYDPEGEVEMARVGAKRAGRLLDGVEYHQFPEGASE